jgi:hypothetical protein
MNTLILFREGLSGHYLKALIDNSPDDITFRVDPWYPGIYDQLECPKHGQTQLLPGCHCLHRNTVDQQTLMTDYDLVFSILVYRKIYHGIYNNFHKKLLVEQLDLRDKFSRWHSDTTIWYDIAFYNLKEYFGLFQLDHIEHSAGIIINFDHLLELDYIEEIFRTHLNRKIDDNTRRIISNYRAHQLQYDLTGDEKSMKDIIAPIPDSEFTQSPWFAAYCIFKYESNNKLSESQRLWSVNNVSGLIDKKILVEIAQQYCC